MNENYEELMKPAHERYLRTAAGAVVATSADHAPPAPVVPGSASSLATYHKDFSRELREQLLGRIYVHNHDFFERLIIDVLLEMGYSSRRRDLARCLGRSHDGGVDGMIPQDELGLDIIYVQAKRLKPNSTVAVSQVRDFAGSLEARRATKGIFVTTSRFTPAAHDFVQAISRRLVLVSGDQLADIMVRHNIGVRVTETYQFKELEPAYFKSVADSRRLSP
jgi:restriction system protein